MTDRVPIPNHDELRMMGAHSDDVEAITEKLESMPPEQRFTMDDIQGVIKEADKEWFSGVISDAIGKAK